MSKLFKKRNKNTKGFTLIELIVVIAILGILAMIAVPRLFGFQENAREASDIAAANILASSAKMLVASDNIVANTTYTVAELAAEDLVEAGVAFTSQEYLTATESISIVYTAADGKVVVNGSVVANNPVNTN